MYYYQASLLLQQIASVFCYTEGNVYPPGIYANSKGTNSRKLKSTTLPRGRIVFKTSM